MLSLAMKPANPDFSAACERLTERALQVERGTLLTFAALEDLTGLTRLALYRAVIRVTPELLNAKRLLTNIYGEGYLLSDVQEHMDHADNRGKKGNRQHMRRWVEYQGLDLSRLTPDQKRQYDQKIAHIGLMAELSRKRTIQGIQHAVKSVSYQQQSLAIIENLQAQLASMKRKS